MVVVIVIVIVAVRFETDNTVECFIGLFHSKLYTCCSVFSLRVFFLCRAAFGSSTDSK